MWILISVVVVAILAVGAAVIFVNALGSAFNIFNAHSHSVNLLRWPDGWWPRKEAERRWPLSYACMDKALWNKPAPEMTLAEMEKAIAAYSERAEAVYAAHKGIKPEYGAEVLVEARAARTKAVELRQQGKQLDAWSSYNDVCKSYEYLLERLQPPS
jgi:hypothetical protein